jgi:hypothetical protein
MRKKALEGVLEGLLRCWGHAGAPWAWPVMVSLSSRTSPTWVPPVGGVQVGDGGCERGEQADLGPAADGKFMCASAANVGQPWRAYPSSSGRPLACRSKISRRPCLRRGKEPPDQQGPPAQLPRHCYRRW